MALADDLKTLARNVRAIPGQFGIRPHRVYLVTTTWGGNYTGDGFRADEVTEITEADSQPPKVRWLTDDEIAVGNISNGTIEVGPITSAGGITLEELRLDDAAIGSGRYLKITGPKHPNGGMYRITEIRADRAIHWKMRAAPVETRNSE
jgi:hypothetical protein